MKMYRNLISTFVSATVIVALASTTHAGTIPVTGWVVHNGTSTVTDGTTNSPTFTPAGSNMDVMATFPQIHLANDGDYVTVKTTLTLGTRTGSTANTGLNTQLRLGLMGGADPIVAGDMGNTGTYFEYNSNGGNVSDISDAVADPLTNPLSVPGHLSALPTDTYLQGADIGPVDFELTLTRNSGMLVVTGHISGTDSVSGDPFDSTISPAISYSPAGSGFDFDFNRVAFGFRNNVKAPDGTLNNVTVTSNLVVPEPASCVLAAVATMAGMVIRRRRHRVLRRS
jgi:hypothetical protein